MKENIGFILTFAAMMLTIAMLQGCQQLGRGDVDGRHVRVIMSAANDSCYMEVNGDSVQEATDDTTTVNHPLSSG